MKIAFYCDTDYRVKNDIFVDDYDEEYSNFVRNIRFLGHESHTLDIFWKRNQTVDVCIFFDVPRKMRVLERLKKSGAVTIVWLREPYNVYPKNYDDAILKEFDFVQTWKKDLWDHKKYFPYTPGRVGQNLKTFDVTNVSWIPFTKKKRLVCMINANKKSKIPGELYTKRKEIINWYDKNFYHLYKFCPHFLLTNYQ